MHAPVNVVLTGFMGTGKSAVGAELAQLLGVAFVDTDQVIEARHGTIPSIFERDGEDGFRTIERATIAELTQQPGAVIATGGGAMVDATNAEALERWGQVYTLVASPAEIVRRVTADGVTDRPLLNTDDPAATVEAMLSERAGVYSRYVPVRTDRREPAAIAAEIANDLENRGLFVNPNAPKTGPSLAAKTGRRAGGCVFWGFAIIVGLFVLLFVLQIVFGLFFAAFGGF